jgi:hypothetical protein
MKTRVEGCPLIDRLKAGLEGLPQFLSGGLHGPALLSSPAAAQGVFRMSMTCCAKIISSVPIREGSFGEDR